MNKFVEESCGVKYSVLSQYNAAVSIVENTNPSPYKVKQYRNQTFYRQTFKLRNIYMYTY